MRVSTRASRTNKTEQFILASMGFFWCFLMWFASAAFSPSIAEDYGLSIAQLGILASSAIWLAPVGRIVAGWAADRIGAPNTFAIILVFTGLFSIGSAFASSYNVLFIMRVVVAMAGVSFVVGIQHVAQWFEDKEIGLAEGLFAGTGNVGAGMGALLLPRIYGTNYSDAFLHLGLVALLIGAVYYWRGVAAKTEQIARRAAAVATPRDSLFVWTRYCAIALMLAYAMAFGLEIGMNAWLPGYYAKGFSEEIKRLGFTGAVSVQVAAGTFAAVESFNASLWRPFSGYMSDIWQRKGWMPFPIISKHLPYSPRIHWLAMALVLITIMMVLLTVAGLLGYLHMSVLVLAFFGIAIAFGTGGTFAIVPLMFRDRPGAAAGFIGGFSTGGGIIYPLVYGFLPNIHMGYAFVALSMFIPIILFYFWTMRYERHPEEHGMGSKEHWLGTAA
ncbi:MAG: transporter [Dehalococcoidia bacterium]|nr:transporter [Dehalococcoidia bacterium]